jgi:hypothetical protein
MDLFALNLKIPEELVADFASDPLSQWDKVLNCSDDATWPLYRTLRDFIEELPRPAIEWAYSDETFLGLYGRNEQLARIWFTQHLLIEEVARRRLDLLARSGDSAVSLPYSVEALRAIEVDGEEMVRLSDFTYNGTSLEVHGFSFVTCLLNHSSNSTYWLQAAFYEQSLADHVRVRLDPFLWGPSESFPRMGYKMLVYAMPLNWEGIEKLREVHHGQMRPENSRDRTETTEFCWIPRDDGVHFICEELPRRDLVGVQASRYLHAIYDPGTRTITHFDGALRIYTAQQMASRLKEHVRNAGKAGIRKKIFRIDAPVDRGAFSLIAQAFFIWNYDLTKYFRETIQQGI